MQAGVRELCTDLRTEMQAGVKDLRTEMHSGFSDLSGKIDQTNARLDQTNTKLDDVSTKVGGIASFLLASEQNGLRLEGRIVSLEDRMDRFDKRHDSA